MIKIDKKLTPIAFVLVTGFAHTAYAVEYDIYGKAEVQIAKTDNGTMRFAKKARKLMRLSRVLVSQESMALVIRLTLFLNMKCK